MCRKCRVNCGWRIRYDSVYAFFESKYLLLIDHTSEEQEGSVIVSQVQIAVAPNVYVCRNAITIDFIPSRTTPYIPSLTSVKNKKYLYIKSHESRKNANVGLEAYYIRLSASRGKREK